MNKITMVGFLIAITFTNTFSQLTFPGCPNVAEGDFSSTELVLKGGGSPEVQDASLAEPIQFDLDPVMQGNTISSVDAYIIERKGKVKYFNSTSKSITEIGDLDVRAKIVGGATDYGLMGIALDPDFKTNNWMYLWWAPRTDEQGTQYGGGDWKRIKLSRFTLGNNKQIQMNSEKVLLEFRGNKRDDWHGGGPMTFDSYGDLWITIGNNSTDHNNGGTGSHISTTDSVTSDEWGASNTASFRGSIIRIHPDDSQKGYTVPAGNFGEYWGDYFEGQGNNSLAAEYRDPVKTLPEIYTKGHRSNFSITVHPTKRWLAWADVNPGGGDDEQNITNVPLYGGYPYFYGDQKRTSGHNQNIATPTNNSPFNSGVVNLPPADPPTTVNLANVAITGPIYVYDSTLSSTTKFPPHFHEQWIQMSFNNRIFISKVNGDGSDIVNNSTQDIGGGGNLLGNLRMANPIAAKFGPEGAFYLLNYAGHYNNSNDPTGLYRLDYTGTCLPFKTPVLEHSRKPMVSLTAGLLYVNEANHEISMYNLKGNRVIHLASEKSSKYSLVKLQEINQLENGIYLMEVKTPSGKYSHSISLF